MIAVPFSFGAPLVGSLSPSLRTPLPRSDTASRISFEDELWDQIDREDPDSSSNGSGAANLGGLSHQRYRVPAAALHQQKTQEAPTCPRA